MTDPFVATLASGMQMFNLNPFSTCAVTGMDKICGWEDEEKTGGFEIRRIYVDLHQRGVDKRAKTH